MRSRSRILTWCSLIAAVRFLAACTDPTRPSDEVSVRMARGTASEITVKSAIPSQAPQNITLDVVISGSGFQPGSSAKWLLNGLEDPRVTTNSTTVTSSTSITANITIAADAVPSLYDIAVVTSSGKKGIGTEKFTVLDMEQLPSGDGSGYANDVSTSGLIVGNALLGCDDFTRPVIWQNGVISALPLPSGLCRGRGLAITESTGAIIGMLYPPGATSLVQAIPVIWEMSGSDYVVQELGLAPDGTRPYDVLDANEIEHVVANVGIRKAFWWSESTGWVRLADAAGSTGCYAKGVNDLDQITGQCEFIDAGGKRIPTAVVWPSPWAVPELLPRVTGFNYVNSGEAINNNGIVAGQAWDNRKTGMVVSGVQWTPTSSGWTIDIMPGLGGKETHPSDINDDGWISGSSQVSGGKYHGIIWRKGEALRDLGSIGTDSYANAISPSGSAEILAVGQSVSGSGYAAVLWRPFN